MSAQSPQDSSNNINSVRRNNRVISAPSFESQEPHHEDHTNAVYDSIASNIRYYDELRRGKPPQVPGAVVRSSSNGSSRRTKSPARVPVTRVVPTTDVYTPHSSHLDGSNLATHHMVSPRLSASCTNDQYPNNNGTEVPTREPTRAPVSLPRAEGPGKAQSSPSPPRFAVSKESVEQRLRARSNSPTTPLSTTVKPYLDGTIASPVADPSFERRNSASKKELKSMAPESPVAHTINQESNGQVQRVISRPRGPSSLNVSTNRIPQETADMTHVRALGKLPAQELPAKDVGTSVSSLISSTQRPPLAAVPQAVADPVSQGSRRLSDATPTTPKVQHVVVQRRPGSDSLASSVKVAHPPSKSQESADSSPAANSSNKEATMTAGELKWYKQFKQTVTVTKQWREHAEALEKERNATVAEFELLNQHHTNLQGKCVDLVKLVAERDGHVKSLRDTIKELEAANDALRTTPHHQQPPTSDLQRSQQQTIERLSEMLDDQHRSMAHKIEMGGDFTNTSEGDPKAIQQLRTQCSLLATQLAGATDVQRRYKERAAEAEVRFLERQLVEERRRVHELFESLWHLTTPTHNTRSSSNQTSKPTPLPALFPRGVAALESEMNTLSFGGDAFSHRSSPQRLQRGSEHHRLNNLYHMQCVDTTDNCESRLAAYFGVVEGLQQTLIGSRMHQAGAEQASSSMKEVMTEVLESIQEGAKALYKNTKLVSKVRDGLLTQQQLLSRQSRALKSHSRDQLDYPHSRGGTLLEPSESPHHRAPLYAPDGLPPRHTSSAVKASRRNSALDDSTDMIDGRGGKTKDKKSKSKKTKSSKKHRHHNHHTDLNGSNQMSSAYLSDGMDSVDINPPSHAEEGEQYLANNVAEASGMAKETYELFMSYTDRVDTASDILKSCVQGLRAVLRTAPLNGGGLIDESGVSASDVGSEAHRSPSGRRHMVASVLDPSAAPQELLREIEADINSFKQSSSDVVARMSAALQRERLNHKQDCDGYLRRLCLAEDEYRNLLAAVSRYLPPGAEQQAGNTTNEDPYNNYYDNNMPNMDVDSRHNMSRNMAPSNNQSTYPQHQYDTQHYQASNGFGGTGAPTHQYRSYSAPQQQHHYADPIVEEEEEPRFDPIVPGTPISSSIHHNATPTATSRNTSTDFRQPISAVRQRRGSGAFAARQHGGAAATVHRGRSLPTSSTHQMSTSRASTPGGSSHRYYYYNTIDDLVGRAVPVDSGLRQQEPRPQAPHPTKYRTNPATALPPPSGDDLMERSESITTTNRQTPMTHSLPIPPSSRDAESHRTTTVSTTNTRGSIPAPDMNDDEEQDDYTMHREEEEVHSKINNEDLYISVRNSEHSRSFLAGEDVREVVDGNTSGNAAMAIHMMLHGQGGNHHHQGAAPRSRTSVTSGTYEISARQGR